MSTPIADLQVDGMYGEFYDSFRKYLEKHRCVWREIRNDWGELKCVHLTFPDGTTYKPVNSPGWYQIDLPHGGLLYWMIYGEHNHINIPYLLL